MVIARIHAALTIVQVIAIAIFVHGFLLRRAHLPEYNTTPTTSCTNKYTKLVWVVIDALRYDFVVEDSRYPCPLEHGCNAYRGHMPFLSSLLHQDNTSAARLFRYEAEAPTTTTQRLKSMVTGSLPTFFDVSNSFTASALEDDNLIHQFTRAGKKQIFMGDTTWSQLFPDSFNVSLPFPCFNVKDLHTVDDGIWQHLLPTVAQPAHWDILIAHFLGVDHAGHTFGADSPEIGNKLKQMDVYMQQLTDALVAQAGVGGVYENTLLLVCGDHGQTLGGDHGGGSPEEVDSVLAAIDIGRLRTLHQKRKKKFFQKSKSSSSSNKDESTVHNGEVAVLSQIDAVPTLASLLGVPIPFGNLGRVSPDLWNVAADRCSSSGSSSSDKGLANALKENVEQVYRYLHAYSVSVGGSGLPKMALRHLDSLYDEITSIYSSGSSSSDVLCVEKCTEFLAAAHALAQAAWTQFRVGSMMAGLGLVLAVVVVQIAMITSVAAQEGGLLKKNSSFKWNLKQAVEQGVKQVRLEELVLIATPVVHAIGIFSFNYLLTEARMVSKTILITAGVLTLLQTGRCCIYAPTNKSTSSLIKVLGLGLVCIAVNLAAASLGLVQHTGFSFWQKLTHHGPTDVEVPPTAITPTGYSSANVYAYVVASITAIVSQQRAPVPAWVVDNGRIVVMYVLPVLVISGLASRRVKAACCGWFGTGRVLSTAAFVLVAAHQLLHQMPLVNTETYNLLEVVALLPDFVRQHKILAMTVNNSNMQLLLSPLQPLLHLPLQALLPRLVFLICGISCLLACPVLLSSSTSSLRAGNVNNDVVAGVRSKALVVQYILLPLVLILSKPHVPMIMVLLLVEFQALFGLITNKCGSVGGGGDKSKQSMMVAVAAGCVLAELQSQAFFLTGHSCEFAGVNYTAGFAGYNEFHLVRSAALVLLETFGAMILIGLEAPALLARLVSNKGKGLSSVVAVGLLALAAGRSVQAFTAMLSAAVQRRHLYAWALFAPRFVFEVFFVVITNVVVAIVLLL